MDANVPLLHVDSYLEQISGIISKSEIKHRQIKKEEEQKLKLENETSDLEKSKAKFENRLSSSISELNTLKLQISDLCEQNKCLTDLITETNMQRKNEEDMLWKLSQSVYTEIINYCDNVYGFCDEYKFTDMVLKFLYPSVDENRKPMNFEGGPEENTDFRSRKLEELKKHGLNLKEDLSKLKTKCKDYHDLLQTRSLLKYEFTSGSNILELNKEIAQCKNTYNKIENEIYELETNNYYKITTSDASSSNVLSTDATNDGCSGSLNTTVDNYNVLKSNFPSSKKVLNVTCDNDQNPSVIQFVPKVCKRFKITNLTK